MKVRSRTPSPEDPCEQERRWSAFVGEIRAGEKLPFQEQWAAFRSIYSRRSSEEGPPPAWRPTPEQIADSNLGSFMQELALSSYEELHRWSVRERAEFWERVIRRLGVVFAKPPESILDLSRGVADPCWLPGAEMNCADSCFAAPADNPAVVLGREGSTELEVTTYGELESLVNRFAAGLLQQGFKRGDGIGLYLPMNLECVVAYLGIVRAGGYVVSIADSFPPPELRKRLEIGGAHGMVTVERFIRAGRRIDLYEKVRTADAPRTIVIPSGSTPPDLRAGDLVWADLLGPSDEVEPVAADPYEVTNVLFSSGTTGTPKAIPWTHLTPIKCAMDGHFHQDLRPEDVVAWPTNIGWMMGPWLIYATLMNGATIGLHQGVPSGVDFGRFVRHAGITVLGVVPSLVRAWRTSGVLDEIDWSGVRVFSSTGEPSTREDYLWLMSRTGYRAPVIEYCGGTEIGGGYITGTVVQPASPATFTTPALGLDLLVLGDDGKPVEEGKEGEVYLLPPSIGLSQRLLNADHAEVYYRGCPAGPRGEVLRRHGDRMARLPGGWFRAQGRADDTMNLGGIKVSSLDLERVVNTHPALRECAAVAVQPEGEGAEKLVIFAVLNESTDREKLRQELGSMIAEGLNPLFKIHDLVVTDALPYTASNKLMRRRLRAQYDAKLGLRPDVPPSADGIDRTE